MHHFARTALAAVLLSLLFTHAPQAGTGVLRPELWISGGFVDPSYHDSPLAVGRAGAGIEAFKYVSAGICVQVDPDHYFNFAYAGAVFPAIGLFQPYGRFEFGRREDSDDTALGWTIGLRMGNDVVNFLIEAFGVTEPGSANGAAVGLSF